jgi:hypothetical protein
MICRRMGGTSSRGAASAAFMVAFGLGLVGCASPPPADTLEVCATRTNPPTRATDDKCDARKGGGTTGYGLYRWQVPNGGSIDVPDYGRPIYNGGFDAPRVGNTVRASKGASTVSRGGLGVSSGGAKGGSSGS